MSKQGDPELPKEGGTVDFTFAQLQTWMNGEFRKSINDDLDKKMSSLSKKVDATQAEMRTHKAYVERELKNMKARLEDETPRPVASNDRTVATAGNKKSKTEREDYHYWRARRSAKIFPVLGETEDEMMAGLREFFFVKLNMPEDCVRKEEVEHVRRVRL